MEKVCKQERYSRIDGLRAFAAVGIVLMHVKANTDFSMNGFFAESMIPSFTNFVFLFMVISGFSLCCGYYEKFTSGEINLEIFYKKRFAKVWPFFAALCLAELVVSYSRRALAETLANLTLFFGMIPGYNMEIIGVGWFLGLVFVFYFMFPFFCFLLSNKTRAWLAFAATIVLNVLCVVYFKVGRTSIVYSAMFFMAGGMIYLYRKTIKCFVDKFGVIVLLAIAVVAAIYYTVGSLEAGVLLLLFSLMLIYALGAEKRRIDILANPVTKLLSSISMEIYLSHMLVFRVIEKLVKKILLVDGTIGYGIISICTLTGTVLFALGWRQAFSIATRLFKKLSRFWRSENV